MQGVKRLGVLYLAAAVGVIVAQFDYHKDSDTFDQIESLIREVTPENCFIMPKMKLYLPEDSVSHLPEIKEVNINPIFPNRTALHHLHNMAHSRAFFFSYILQSRFKRPALNASESTSEYDPGFMYYFLSTVADVAANPKINSSALYFQPNMAYTSSYKGFFNKTMPLFAPRAFRITIINRYQMHIVKKKIGEFSDLNTALEEKREHCTEEAIQQELGILEDGIVARTGWVGSSKEAIVCREAGEVKKIGKEGVWELNKRKNYGV
ncbi:uncharacterized protein LOC134772643 [Penaeus indicus]|uniref:uncharacterized protein LOC134772643 n=1 Tax=Penaeus indicus TaxID=29960 RepID=UPI00300D7119